jgi:two-component system response regulator FixJ
MRLDWLFVDDPIALSAVEAAIADANERLNRLTPREREVLLLVTNGHLNKQVAHELGVSPRTIENHRLRLMEKVGARTLAQLVRITILAG